MLTRIAAGRVIDPANATDEVRDVWCHNGRVVAAPQDGRSGETYRTELAGPPQPTPPRPIRKGYRIRTLPGWGTIPPTLRNVVGGVFGKKETTLCRSKSPRVTGI